jgi:hypothetical protein
MAHNARHRFFDQGTQPEGYFPESGNLPTTIATAGNVTYNVGDLFAGLILRDPAGSGRSDVSPTAALILAQLKNPQKGDYFDFELRNTADAAETITLTAGTGVTISGTATVAQNNQKRFRVVVTSSTTVTIYSMGTVVF